MKDKILKILSENSNLSQEELESIGDAIQEKLDEQESKVEENMRAEFAAKYEHDKLVMVESLDSFVSDRLSLELKEYQDAKEVARKELEGKAKVLESFVMQSLQKEMQELHESKKELDSKFEKLEGFTLKQLAEEIAGLRQDRSMLVEQRVKMINEGKQNLREAKSKLMEKSVETYSSFIDQVLTKELKAFREDIEKSKKNDFGRKIFEAFASEFMDTHFSETNEIKRLSTMVESVKSQLENEKARVEKINTLAEGFKQEAEKANVKLKRSAVMFRLLESLSPSHRKTMAGMLKQVKTEKLEESFKHYLPSVLNANTSTRDRDAVLTESTVLTAKVGGRGNTALHNDSVDSFDEELDAMLKLAGITNKTKEK